MTNLPLLMSEIRFAIADFLLAAVFLCMIPLVTALSIADMVAGRSCSASSILLVSIALLIFLIAVLTAVISDLLRAAFLFSTSTRFFADLMFGTLVLLLLLIKLNLDILPYSFAKIK